MTGVWYGGVSPHHPFQSSPFHGPRIGPNMLRPRTHAPTLSNARRARRLSTPVSPCSCPCIVLKTSVWKNQSCSSTPRTPIGFCRSWRGPAPNPSIETENVATRTSLMSVHYHDKPDRQIAGAVLACDLRRSRIVGWAWPPDRPGLSANNSGDNSLRLGSREVAANSCRRGDRASDNRSHHDFSVDKNRQWPAD